MVLKKRVEMARLQRGVFLLPNILTSLNLFCGFYSVVASIEGKFVTAAVAIVVSGGFDSLDGRIARATKTTSKFGFEYDSMSDLISFGMAPGLLAYLWALKPLGGRIGWLAAFLFMACGALRLARFNANSEISYDDSSSFFVGLPVTAAAGMVAVVVLFFSKVGLNPCDNSYLILFMLYFLSFLMVSTVRYMNFKNNALFKSINFNVLVTSLLVFIFVASQPSIALFMFGTFYVLSGPIFTIFQSKKTRHLKKPDASDTID